MKIAGELWPWPFTEEVNLSGTYLIRDDRYWMNPWRDSKQSTEGERL